jgi:glucan phosphoethanolaminetransferase (alkaline phosphatase superfamily)
MKKVTYQPRQVRIFLVLLLALAFLLTLKLTRHGSAEARWLALAAETFIAGVLLIFPGLFFPVFKMILIASSLLGNLIFAVISILVFFLILTPIALVMRALGKNFMKTGLDHSLPSYYHEAEIGHDITKQF